MADSGLPPLCSARAVPSVSHGSILSISTPFGVAPRETRDHDDINSALTSRAADSADWHILLSVGIPQQFDLHFVGGAFARLPERRMAQDVRTFSFRKWNLKENNPLILDVRGMAKFSAQAVTSVANSSAWSGPSISVKWADNPGGYNTRDFPVPVVLSAGSPSKIDLDISSVAYLALARINPTASDTLVDIIATAKADSS